MATVLVVDDRASNRELASCVLKYGGHTVIEAHEGAEALEMAHARHPDLVLTDILMPGMDGYQLARELRAALDTAQTPIVFYTAAYLESETRPFADACGVARVLLKSIEPQTLLTAIDEVLAEHAQTTAPIDIDAADREHLHVVSAKLFEKAQELSDTEARFQLMADNSPVGIVFGDRHGSADYVNPRLAQIMQLPTDDLIGLGWLGCAGEHRREILAAVRGPGPPDGQPHYRSHLDRADGTRRWLTVQLQAVQHPDGEYSGFISTVDDVTALVEAEQQRRDAERTQDIEARNRATERLESLSRLAGGVAHDFNNIMGAILGFEDLSTDLVTELTTTGQLAPEHGGTLLEYLERIHKGGKRAAGLTQQLLAFGARKIINCSPLDLNQAVRESNALLAPIVGPRIQLVTNLAANLPMVLAEPTNVAQILLNLTMNASHAMPDGGTLTIATVNISSAGDPLDAGSPPVGGPHARLTVQDTGHGMTPQTLQRAIEPFFTTKELGQGTGLGLATTYGIVNQLGGLLRIDSALDQGTVVTIELPITQRPVETPPPTLAPRGGTETILLAEDEDDIRDVATRILAKAGYAVLAATNGVDALGLAERYLGSIDLLLSDIMMPGMLGTELSARLREQRPGTNVLYMSGYAGDLMNQQGVLEPGSTVLPKPFTANDLLTAIRTMIDLTQT